METNPALCLTRAQVREIDRLASTELGIPSIVLMENAARGAAEQAQMLVRDLSRPRVLVVCGGGNNGGDGYAAARWLAICGADVQIWAVADRERLSAEAAVMAGITRAMRLASQHRAPLATERFDLIVDALLGTGFQGALRADMAQAIERLNRVRREQGTLLVALDLPSGLDADTGQPSDPTIVADLTVTFVAEKTGFAADQARPFLGRVVVQPIGVPPSLITRVKSELT